MKTHHLKQFMTTDNILLTSQSFADRHPQIKPWIVAAAECMIEAQHRYADSQYKEHEDVSDIQDHLKTADEYARKVAELIQDRMGQGVSIVESMSMARWLVELSVQLMSNPANVKRARKAVQS